MNPRDLKLTEHLASFISDSRKKLMERVLNNRTRSITIVLEDIYQPHNASAVIRTCDAFGIQDLHIIENRNRYTLNPKVALGASKWVNMIHYNQNEDTSNTMDCFGRLRDMGYKIIATVPHEPAIKLESIDVRDNIALVFGTEKDGLSECALDNSDQRMKIPMYGFAESFNISVCAALCLHSLINKLRNQGHHWQLTAEEKAELRLGWYRNSIKNSRVLEQQFLNEYAQFEDE